MEQAIKVRATLRNGYFYVLLIPWWNFICQCNDALEVARLQ